ncbi:DUF397 domain-containing protein [Streptomyces sp. NPDC087568]
MEVADAFPGIVPVRDSKVPDGPPLAFGAGSWGLVHRRVEVRHHRIELT